MQVAWLLLRKSGRQSAGRLALTALAIAVGVALLLSFVAGVNGIQARVQRSEWLQLLYSGPVASEAARQAQTPIEGVAPLKVGVLPRSALMTWRDQPIRDVAMAKAGPNAPSFPGLATPAPGEYYVSPGLDKVMRDHPEDGLAQRFGQRSLGVIPEEYVSSPDALEVIRGLTVADLSTRATSQASQRLDITKTKSVIDLYTTTPSGSTQLAYRDPVTPVALAFGATILLFPIVMFVAVATQLGSTQREQRYAALRLVGATRRQVNQVLLLESLAATIVGIILGSLAFLALGGALESVRFAGERFWPSDLSLYPYQYALMVAATIGLSLLANWWAMRKVRTSPLGVARRIRLHKRPRAWRIIPLAAGLAFFAWLATEAGGRWVRSDNQSLVAIMLTLAALVLVMMGLLLAGPWLTRVLSGLMARFTGRATTLIASKRIAGQSRQVFRSVSGVVLALFAGSFYLAAVSNVDTIEARSIQNNGYQQLKRTAVLVAGQGLSDQLLAKVKAQAYVRTASQHYQRSDSTGINAAITCQDLGRYTTRQCPDGTTAGYAVIDFSAGPVQAVTTTQSLEGYTMPIYLVDLTDPDKLDQLRSLLAIQAGPTSHTITLKSGDQARRPLINPVVKDLAAITYVGIAVTLFVAVASLVVSTIGGLLERRKALFTLRLGGMTLGQMRRMVMIESLIPLVTVSVLAAGTGVWIATVFLQVFSSTVRVNLSPAYFAIVAGSLALAVVGIMATLSILRRLTSLEQNQTE